MASSAPEERSQRVAEIVAAARTLLEEGGAEALSMRRVAERLGIRAPSLYKHLAGKPELEAAIISDGFAELAQAFAGAAGEGPRERLAAFGRLYRGFATSHPHLYRLMTARPLPRERLAPGVEEAAARPLVEAAGGDGDLARAVWAFAHGMAILELDGRFPPGADLDAAWEAGVTALAAQVREHRARRRQA